MKDRHKLSLVLAVLLALMLPNQAMSQSGGGEQLYFVGTYSPIGSLSKTASNTGAVYLRWDVLEGSIPADIETFVLRRDDGDEWIFPAHSVLEATAIETLYSSVGQDRRFLETINWLDQLVDLEDDESDNDSAQVTSANFIKSILQRIDPVSSTFDSYWAHLASRVDFNIAQARNRGFVDRTPPFGNTTYTLSARNSSETWLLGTTVVDTSGALRVIPAASDFQQVEISRCDAPEAFKDHGTVYLNWQHGGTNQTEIFANAILIAGYDLYRMDTNLADSSVLPPVRDLRSEAAGFGHAGDGSISFSGLEKINDQLIMISDDDGTEEAYQTFKPPFSQFQELMEDLLVAGMEPGDSRAYYLVGRDLTGNYGETIDLVVTVPDKLAPPPPWAIETTMSTASGKFSLVFDHVNLENYYSSFKRGKKYCNLNSALVDEKLCYVDTYEQCSTSPQKCIDLDIDHYNIYRFDSQGEAAAFKDTDGDGYADRDEQIKDVSFSPARIDVGTACDPLSNSGGTDYLAGRQVSAANVLTRASGRKVIEFLDPDISPSPTIFWYRIASVDTAGNVGFLSAPVRGFFPDKTRPDPRPLCTDQGQVDCISCVEERCFYEIIHPSGALREFVEDKTDDAVSVDITCRVRDSKGGGYIIPCSDPNTDISNAPADQHIILADLKSRRVGGISDEICGFGHDLAQFSVTFNDIRGRELATKTYPVRLDCDLPPVLVKDCTNPTRYNGVCGFEPRDYPIIWNWYPKPDECASLYREINGTRSRIGQFCGDIVLYEDDLPGRGGQICLSLDVHNQNNSVSSTTYLPCFTIVDTDPPGPPTPTQIVYDESVAPATATMSWLSPEVTLAGTIVEWSMKGDAESFHSQFIALADNNNQDGTIFHEIELPNLNTGGDFQEEWCFRGRSVGIGLEGKQSDLLSPWSASLCVVRSAIPDVLPEYMPWPAVPEPPQLGTIQVDYIRSDRVPALLFSDPLDITLGQCKPTELIGCDYDKGQMICENINISRVRVPFCGFCDKLKNAVGDRLGFVLYRQSKTSSGVQSNFIQVSPFLDTYFCDDSQNQGLMEDPYFRLVVYPDPPVDAEDWNGTRLVYFDLYPFERGVQLRYQLVYFDNDGEIVGYRTTDWLDAD